MVKIMESSTQQFERLELSILLIYFKSNNLRSQLASKEKITYLLI